MLTAADVSMFASIGVTASLIGEAHIRRVSDAEARELLSLPNFKGDLGGIEFPYYGPSSNGNRLTSHIRRDFPEVEDDKPKN